jgi:hypothetical protein
MSLDMSAMQSRRALLMSGVGSFAALAVSALGRPSPVQAGSDGDVVLGASNATTTTTEIKNITNNDAVFAASSVLGGVGGGGNGVGISEGAARKGTADLDTTTQGVNTSSLSDQARPGLGPPPTT